MFLHIENGKNFFERNGSALDRLINAAQALHRPEKSADVTEKRNECAQSNLTLQHEKSAKRDGGDAREHDNKICRCAESAIDAHAANDDLIGFFNFFEKTFLLTLFHRKAAHCDDAGE